MWGNSRSQRLRLAPLYLALVAANRLARVLPRPARRELPGWQAGVSVLIPDRDAPDMLAQALSTLFDATARVTDPIQVIVVANGAPVDRYREIRSRFPQVELVHSDTALGFGGAIELGMEHVRHDWTFLLNNDMTLEPQALAELLPLRGNDVFAIGSQIFQKSADGRREETGFTDWYTDPSGFAIYHAPVLDDETLPHLCVSGGAGLFRTALLRGYVKSGRCYDPFYWEDVEWSVRALRDGYRVLFCPRSQVTHRHRATTARFYKDAEIDRVVQRNRLLFDMRQAITDNGSDWLMDEVCALPYQSQVEFTRFNQAVGLLRERLHARQHPLPSPPPALPAGSGKTTIIAPSYSYRLRVAEDNRPARTRMLLITPFALYPARHGGARRVAELINVLREHYDIVLITDEARLYDLRSFTHFDGLYAVHLVQRDGDPKGVTLSLAERIASHCHPRLVAAVEDAMRLYRPKLVQLEHVEVAGLVRLKIMDQPWVLGLHDAYGESDFRDADEAARFRRDVLDKFDAVTVCSQEDAALVEHRRVVCVPNGAPPSRIAYRPSTSSQLLFIGPFRYAPNLAGILRFLDDAFPRIRAAVPAVTLRVLGGDDAHAIASRYTQFAQAGVEVFPYREDVPQLLDECALTINPLEAIRGSAIKLIESLSAGRACVSTEEGARGYRDGDLAGLITVPSVAEMVAPIVTLLSDAGARHRIEAPEQKKLDRYQWTHCAGVQHALYQDLLRGAS